jgi:hypothetical protein
MVSKEIAQRAFRFSCRIVRLYERLIKKGGAARETVYWLQLLVSTGLVAREEVAWELSEAEQFVPILGAIVFNARQNSDRGGGA